MTHPEVLVLLAARLCSRAPAERVRDSFVVMGGAAADFPDLLAEAHRLEQVRCRGEEERWSLTPAGEAELAAHLGAETDQVGRADLGTAYEAFLPLNREFLATLSATPTLDSLEGLVDRLRPILHALSAVLGRFGLYERRLDHALAGAVDDQRWIASPALDSVHSVWFELHEHLLATLGRDRTQER